ncbi:MAG: glycoside hydrolase family 99-like domain-containing protein [Clostridia bacterium]|nr:glycoside hydrolase family 99-like domain-containing protein [Clostridia bacterium]
MTKYDIAAYVWPSYTGKELRSRQFWPDGIGEWQTVMSVPSRMCHKPSDYKWDRKPIWGCCDEADPKVMEMQIEEAVKHGVNVFIYDWYWYDRRPFLEQCLDEGFLGASNNGKMKFYIMWANHDAGYTWDTRLSSLVFKGQDPTVWLGSVDRVEFEKVAHRVIKNYFSKPNYYKINGKPVFMIYDIDNLVKGLGGIEATLDALEWFRAETVKAGHPGLELQLTAWGERVSNMSGVDGERTISTKEVVPTLGFDSVTNYQFVHFCNMNRKYSEILPEVYNEWERMDKDYSVPYYPHVSIGWDNNPRFVNFTGCVCKENTPQEFEKALRKAKEYVDTHSLPAPLITVNSWNEWTETSYLEPDNLYGYGYLDAVKKVFVDELK